MKFKALQLNFATVLLRFYLMMAVVIGAFFAGVPVLAILALPIFFSALIGVEITFPAKRRESIESKRVQIAT